LARFSSGHDESDEDFEMHHDADEATIKCHRENHRRNLGLYLECRGEKKTHLWVDPTPPACLTIRERQTVLLRLEDDYYDPMRGSIDNGNIQRRKIHTWPTKPWHGGKASAHPSVGESLIYDKREQAAFGSLLSNPTPEHGAH